MFKAIVRNIKFILNEIEERRFRFKVTLEGIMFVIVTLAIGLAALNTGTQLLFLLFAMMCAFWVLSAIMAQSSLSDLKISRDMPREVNMLEPVTVRFKVFNKKNRWTSYSIRIIDFLEDLTPVGAAFVAEIKPGKTQHTEYRCIFPQRGVHRFRKIHTTSRYPFGWIKRSTSRPLKSEVLVLPALLPVEQELESERIEAGDVSSHKKGQGAGLYGIRKYSQGESIRDIHWKITARSGNLMVREYESDERRKASVIIDNRVDETDEHLLDRLELGIVVTASLVNLLIKRGYQVELVTASGSVGFDERPAQVKRCQRALALLTPVSKDAHPPTPSDQDSEVYQVTLQKSEKELVPKSAVIYADRFRAMLTEALEKSPKPSGSEKMSMETLQEQDKQEALENASPTR